MIAALVAIVGLAGYSIYTNMDKIKGAFSTALGFIGGKVDAFLEKWRAFVGTIQNNAIVGLLFGGSESSLGFDAQLTSNGVERLDPEQNIIKQMFGGGSGGSDGEGTRIDNVNIHTSQEVSSSTFEHFLEMSTS